jgi:hypothetical protein
MDESGSRVLACNAWVTGRSGSQMEGALKLVPGGVPGAPEMRIPDSPPVISYEAFESYARVVFKKGSSLEQLSGIQNT